VGTWSKYGGQPAERVAPPRWPRVRRGESRAYCRGSRPRGVGIGDVELVDRLLLDGEEGVELFARHVEVEVCLLEEGKGTEYLLHEDADDIMVGTHELVGQPVSHAPRLSFYIIYIYVGIEREQHQFLVVEVFFITETELYNLFHMLYNLPQRL